MRSKKLLTIISGMLFSLPALFLLLFRYGALPLSAFPLLHTFAAVPIYSYSFADAGLHSPVGIAVDSERVFVADTRNRRVVVFSRDGEMERQFGRSNLKDPNDLAVYDGFIYVADFGGQRIQVFSTEGNFIKTLFPADGDKEYVMPTAIALDKEGENIYFTDAVGHRVVVVDREGVLQFTAGFPGSAEGALLYPNGIALDDKKNIYVADSNNGRVQVFSPDGKKVIKEISGGSKEEDRFALPCGLAIDGKGNLWVADALTHTVSVFSGQKKKFSIRLFTPEQGGLYFPNRVVLDDNGYLYITERAINRVSVFAFPGRRPNLQ